MQVSQLLELLSDGDYHSGESLGRRLGMTRAAIWKQVRELRTLGVEVHAVTGKGYRLPNSLQLLDRQAIMADSRWLEAMLGDRFSLHFSLDSTNAQAMRELEQGNDRCLIMAEHQYQGRGRRGRPWVSPLGHNLYLSLVWPFGEGAAALEGLSLVCALAVVNAVERLGVVGAGVKWPNDVLIDNRKLAGILLEVQGDLEGPCTVIIGVGVNTDMPAAAAASIDQPFSDLGSAGNGGTDRNRIAAEVIDALLEGVEQFGQDGFRAFHGRWMEKDVLAGSRVEVRSGSRLLTGRLAGVNEAGRLLLDAADKRHVISGGEIASSLRSAATQRG